MICTKGSGEIPGLFVLFKYVKITVPLTASICEVPLPARTNQLEATLPYL